MVTDNVGTSDEEEMPEVLLPLRTTTAGDLRLTSGRLESTSTRAQSTSPRSTSTSMQSSSTYGPSSASTRLTSTTAGAVMIKASSTPRISTKTSAKTTTMTQAYGGGYGNGNSGYGRHFVLLFRLLRLLHGQFSEACDRNVNLAEEHHTTFHSFITQIYTRKLRYCSDNSTDNEANFDRAIRLCFPASIRQIRLLSNKCIEHTRDVIVEGRTVPLHELNRVYEESLMSR